MSKAEIERFVSDIKADAKLQSELKAKQAGIPTLIQIARERGYDITVEDVRQHVRAQGQDLTDEQLETVAGGRPNYHIIYDPGHIAVIWI